MTQQDGMLVAVAAYKKDDKRQGIMHAHGMLQHNIGQNRAEALSICVLCRMGNSSCPETSQ